MPYFDVQQIEFVWYKFLTLQTNLARESRADSVFATELPHLLDLYELEYIPFGFFRGLLRFRVDTRILILLDCFTELFQALVVAESNNGIVWLNADHFNTYVV